MRNRKPRRFFLLAVLAALIFGWGEYNYRAVLHYRRSFQNGEIDGGDFFRYSPLLSPSLRSFGRGFIGMKNLDLETAHSEYNKAILDGSATAEIAARAYYNLGQLSIFLFRQGYGTSHLAQAVGHYSRALEIKPDFREAKENLEQTIKLFVAIASQPEESDSEREESSGSSELGEPKILPPDRENI